MNFATFCNFGLFFVVVTGLQRNCHISKKYWPPQSTTHSIRGHTYKRMFTREWPNYEPCL